MTNTDDKTVQWLAQLEIDGTTANVAELVYELTGWDEERCLQGAHRLIDLLAGHGE